jgi:hypothetical protein
MKIAQNQMEVASQMIAVRSMPDVKQREQNGMEKRLSTP